MQRAFSLRASHFFVLLALAAAVGLSAQTPAAVHPVFERTTPLFRVQVTGKGPPILFIPGLSSSGETWETTVARYQDRFECHVLTLAGFAGVPRVDLGDAAMLPQVRDAIAAYVRSAKLDKPVLVGHSLGGFLAIDLASHDPGLFGKLVIVDAYPFTMGVDPNMTPGSARSLATQIGTYVSGMTQEAYEAYVRSGAATDNMVISKGDQQRLIEWSLASDRRMVGAALAEMLGADLREDVAKIKVPTMVLAAWHGSEDEGATYAVVDKNMHAQYATLAGVEIHVSDTARHFIMWDDPAWFFGHLDRFLAAGGTK